MIGALIDPIERIGLLPMILITLGIFFVFLQPFLGAFVRFFFVLLTGQPL